MKMPIEWRGNIMIHKVTTCATQKKRDDDEVRPMAAQPCIVKAFGCCCYCRYDDCADAFVVD